MKGGAAIHLANILYFSEHVHLLEGNLLLLFNGDEEGEHRGIISALTEFERLKQEKQLQYRLAINNDFITLYMMEILIATFIQVLLASFFLVSIFMEEKYT